MSDVLFYILSFGILFFAIIVVTIKNLLHAALALISTLFLTGVLYIGLHAEFVAVAQVLVYIGGVVIFIVFTIFLTSKLGERPAMPGFFSKIFGVLCAGQLIVFAFVFTRVLPVGELKSGERIADLETIGQRLLDTRLGGFIVPFEIISVLLLSALIGAVALARKEPEHKVKTQSEQAS